MEEILLLSGLRVELLCAIQLLSTGSIPVPPFYTTEVYISLYVYSSFLSIYIRMHGLNFLHKPEMSPELASQALQKDRDRFTFHVSQTPPLSH